MENTFTGPSRILSGLFLALVTGTTLAQPAINSVDLEPQGNVVVRGQSFGNGPNIVLYDNFDDAQVVDGELRLSPQIGEWYELSSSSPSLQEDNSSDLSLFVRGPAYTKLTFGVRDSDGVYGLKSFQEVYFSYNIRDIGEFPGDGGTMTSFSNISSTKDAWMMLGNRGDNTNYSVSIGQPAGNDLYVPAWTGDGFNIAGNNTRMDPSYWQEALTNSWDFGGWNLSMFHAKLNPNDPYGPSEGFFSFANKNRYNFNPRNGNFMEDLRAEGVPYPFWDRIKFFAWLRTGDAEVQRLLDDVYVAIGPNANARLLITDAKELEETTIAYHLPVSRWNDDEIAASVPEHLLKDSNKTYFVVVIDSKNNRSTSIPLCPNCPSAPAVDPVR